MSTRASVSLWGTKIGAVLWGDRGYGIFEYTPEFIEFGIEVAPFTMPTRPGPIDCPGLSKDTFKGLPGMLSDSLPDKFGNLLIDQWLARQGRADRAERIATNRPDAPGLPGWTADLRGTGPSALPMELPMPPAGPIRSCACRHR